MAHLLEPVGLSEVDNDIYVVLLDADDDVHVDQLHAKVGCTPEQALASINALADHGLASRSRFSEPVYRAIAPELAIPHLIDLRRRDLIGLQARVDELAQQARARGIGRQPVVEWISGDRIQMDVFERLRNEAESEVLAIDAPPYLAGGSRPNDAEFHALARGVSYRVVYHPDSLNDARNRGVLEQFLDSGEEARLLAEAFPKMAIFDRRIAIVIASGSRPDPNARLLVHPSSLLDLLVTHFETLWSQAAPLTPGEAPSNEISGRDRDLLALLASGMKDRGIAETLGVTERTVGRRIAELMTRLNADTRFLAGVRAVQRGWIPAS